MTTMIRIAATVLLVVLLVPEYAVAQRPPQRAQRPDRLNAGISGKVTTADTGAPIRGAEVRLLVDGRSSRLATTDSDGRYELRDLPAGDYRVSASRTGFVSLQYGQRRPFEAASVIRLAEGARVEANVALIRGGVIYGRVLDQFGEPLAGARVQALRSHSLQGRRRLESVAAPDLTDDTGAFRIYGLPPGDYYVSSAAGLGDQVKREPPTYYPGTANFADAQPITLAAGVEASADFQLAPVRNARVSGIAVNSAGVATPAMVNLVSAAVSTGPGIEGSVSALQLHADAAPDGTFTIENVPPGPYSLTAMLMPVVDPIELRTAIAAGGREAVAEMRRRMPETGSMPVVVNGDDIGGLTLVMQKPSVLSASFVADTGVARPLPKNLQVSLRSNSGLNTSMGATNRSSTDFELVTPAGPFMINVGNVPEGWTVKSILLDGRDVIDEPIDLKGDNGTVRIVLSDRASSVVGSVRLRGEPVDYAVVVFSEDPAKWTSPSRYLKTARADSQGRFRIDDLPGGERYLAAAVDYLESGEQEDPQFLERIRSRATTFALGEGEQRSVFLEGISR